MFTSREGNHRCLWPSWLSWRLWLYFLVLGGWVLAALLLQKMEFRAGLPAGWRGLWDGDRRPLLDPLMTAYAELDDSLLIDDVDGNPAYHFPKGSRAPIGRFMVKSNKATTVAAWVRFRDPILTNCSIAFAGVPGTSFWSFGAWEGRPAVWHMVWNTNLPPPQSKQIVPHRLTAPNLWSANEWVHLALVGYVESSEFYVNGRLVDGTDYRTMYESFEDTFLGHVRRDAHDPLPETSADSLQTPPDLWIDDFVIFGRPLSATDVANVVRAGRGALRYVPEWRDRHERIGFPATVTVLTAGIMLLGAASYKRSWGTALIGHGSEVMRPAYAPVWGMLLLGCILSILLGTRLHRDARKSDEARLAEFGEQFVKAAEYSMERVADLLIRARDFIRTNPDFTQVDWDNWCEENGLKHDHVGLEMAWAPKVEAEDLESWLGHLNRSNRERYPSELGDGADAPGFHLPVRYTFAKTRQAIGWDWLGVFTKGEISREQAREIILSKHSVTPLLRVPIRPTELGMRPLMGLHLYLPVYKTPRPPKGHREQELVGVVYASLSTSHQIAEHWRSKPPVFGARIYSASTFQPETFLVDTSELYINTRKPYRGSLEKQVRIRVYGDRLYARIWTTQLFTAQSMRRLGLYVAGGGTGFTLLAAVLLGVQIRARRVQLGINQTLQATTDRLKSAQEERRQLSRDLHDGAIQSLYAIQLELGHNEKGSTETVVQEVDSHAFPHSAHPVKDLDLRIDAIISELRRFLITDEVEAALERQVRLDEVLQSFVHRLSKASQARIHFNGDPEVSRELTTDQSLQLAFIAHEALSNSLRHAAADEILLVLQPAGSGMVRLMVSDNGCGYRMDEVHSGVGLRSMRQRAEQLRAELRMISSPGQGTRLIVELMAHGTKAFSEVGA